LLEGVTPSILLHQFEHLFSSNTLHCSRGGALVEVPEVGLDVPLGINAHAMNKIPEVHPELQSPRTVYFGTHLVPWTRTTDSLTATIGALFRVASWMMKSALRCKAIVAEILSLFPDFFFSEWY
jgi:hypothetical protein